MNCRYYGKHQLRTGQLIDQHGNQCGAITYAYAPCMLETRGAQPDEKACDLAVHELRNPSPHAGAGVIVILDPAE